MVFKKESLSKEQLATYNKSLEFLGALEADTNIMVDKTGLQNPAITKMRDSDNNLKGFSMPKEGGRRVLVIPTQISFPFNPITLATDKFNEESPFIYQGTVSSMIDIIKTRMLVDEELLEAYRKKHVVEDYSPELGVLTAQDMKIFKKYISVRVYARTGVAIRETEITKSKYEKTYDVPGLNINWATREVGDTTNPVYQVSQLLRALGDEELDRLATQKDTKSKDIYEIEETRIKDFKKMINVFKIDRKTIGYEIEMINGETEISNVLGGDDLEKTLYTKSLRIIGLTGKINTQIKSVIEQLSESSNIDFVQLSVVKEKNTSGVFETSYSAALEKCNLDVLAQKATGDLKGKVINYMVAAKSVIDNLGVDIRKEMESGFYIAKWDNVMYKKLIAFLSPIVKEKFKEGLITEAIHEAFPMVLDILLDDRDRDKLAVKHERGKLSAGTKFDEKKANEDAYADGVGMDSPEDEEF